jgi:hypothetical protein
MSLVIDYAPGAYGNFIRYVINRHIFQMPTANFDPFNDNGASHNGHPEYFGRSTIKLFHYSFFKCMREELPFFVRKISQSDIVLQIEVGDDDYYHVYYNDFVRSTKESIALHDLEIDTLTKMNSIPKYQRFKAQLISRYGELANYSRNSIKQLFYDDFCNYKEFWLAQRNTFYDYKTQKVIRIAVSDIINLESFLIMIQKVSMTLINKTVDIDQSIIALHNKFIECNAGWNSLIKCQHILQNIVCGNHLEFTINSMEEAWIDRNIEIIFGINYQMIDDCHRANTKSWHDEILKLKKEI